MDSKLQELYDYAQAQLQHGYTPQAIRNHLRQSGWSDLNIDAALGVRTLPAPTSTQYAAPYGGTVAAQPNSKKSLFVKIAIVAVVLLAVVGAVFLFHKHSGSKKNPATAPTSQQSSTPSTKSPSIQVLQSESKNNLRQNDVSNLAVAIEEYINNNNGTLPGSTATDPNSGSLAICGFDCSSSEQSTVALVYYANNPSAVSFQDYSTTLTISGTNAVFIVSGAVCNDAHTGVKASSGRSVALLYALQTDSGSEQRCTDA